MELYNDIIQNTVGLLSAYSPENLEVNSKSSWEMCGKNELILSKEAAFEMGGSRLPSLNYSCVTTSTSLIEEDSILLLGPDLKEIKNDVPFIRIALISIKDLGDDEEAYRAIKNLEYVKYDIIPKGYMMRASSFDRREQVRVSKEAILKGINFGAIGNAYINKLKENELVKAACIIFITKNIPEFKLLNEFSNKVEAVTQTLNHALSNSNLDCESCSLKSICDEVDGMKELHFKHLDR